MLYITHLHSISTESTGRPGRTSDWWVTVYERAHTYNWTLVKISHNYFFEISCLFSEKRNAWEPWMT